ISRTETAAEVPGGGRVGDPLCSQRVAIDLIIAEPFEMFDALAPSEDIESDVQDRVGLVVGQMPFEQVKIAVDLLDEIDLLSKEKDGPDAAGTEPTDAIGMLVVDVGGRHHGYGPLGAGCIVESFLDAPPCFLEESLLACRTLFSESSTHSKAPLLRNSEDVISPPLFQKLAGFSSPFPKIATGGLYITLG